MKKFDIINLIKKYKKLSLCTLILISCFLYVEFSFIFHHTIFKIYNKTGYNIIYKIPELPNSSEPDPYLTEKEDDSMQYFYSLKNNESTTVHDSVDYWYSSKRFLGLFFGIDDKYHVKPNAGYRYELKPAGFIDEPTYPNQKPSCSFKIEVYPDRTVVTPTYKRFCKKPMYNYENFNPYSPAHQSKSY